MRFGTVALVGPTNVGKSTFLNQALGEPLAIVSRLPQTTRDALLGVVNAKDAQIALLDTPGAHRPRNELGRRMNAAALDASRTADAVLLMVDAPALVRAGAGRPGPSNRAAMPTGIPPELRDALGWIPEDTPTVLVLNKVDKIKAKSTLLPVMEALAGLRAFATVIPASVLERADVERILAELAVLLPEGPPGYDEDVLTNRPTAFFIREYIREQVLLTAVQEVPHAIAVELSAIEDHGNTLSVLATVHCEKIGQRKILIGRNGEQIKAIGTRARQRIEQLVGKHVRLELFVRVTPRWKDMPRQLSELGYEASRETHRDERRQEDS